MVKGIIKMVLYGNDDTERKIEELTEQRNMKEEEQSQRKMSLGHS